MNPSTGSNQTPGGDAASNPIPAKDARFSFPLPFDPVRLAGGVLSRWPWIVAGAVLLGGLGALIGTKITHPHYAITVSLIKRRVTQTVQASEVGQAYRPVDLNDATLLATLLANEALDAAVKRAGNGIQPDRARTLVEAEQLEGTDIFRIIYHSPVSREDALRFGAIWAEEINAYTQRLQQTEAREVQGILRKEVDEMQKRIDSTNLELLEFSKSKDFLGGDAQVSAALAKLAQIELQLDQARAEVKAKEQQLKNLTEEIRHQSPLELQLKTARDELANLRSTFTDSNPLVQAKLQSIEYLKEQVARLDEQKMENLESYTGTPLGNQLYLSIVEQRNNLAAASSKIASLEQLYQTTSARIAEFPGIVTAYDAIKDKRESLSDGLALMSNRLKEAEIFASSAPGYWQLFQAPDPRSIEPSSSVKKPLAFALLGACAGGGAAVLLTLLLTQRSTRRSALECCSAAKAPFAVQLPGGEGPGIQPALRRFWITRLDKLGSPALFWTSALDPDDERRFWSALAEIVLADGRGKLLVRDLSPDGLWTSAPLPGSLNWIGADVDGGHDGSHCFLRASDLPPGADRGKLAAVSRWFFAVSGDAAHLALAADARSLTDACLPPCAGTVAMIDPPIGMFRIIADKLSRFLAERFSAASSP